MRTHSIRTRLINFMLAATIIPLVLSLVITMLYTRESIKTQSINENTRLIFQGKTNLTNYLSNINRASILVYSDPNFLYNLTKSIDDYQAMAEMYSTLQNLQGSLPDIKQVYLHNEQTKQSTLITDNVPKRNLREKAYESAINDSEKSMLEPPHALHSYGFTPSPNDNPNEKVFTFHRPILRIPSTVKLASLAIDIRLDGIQAICNQLYNAQDEELYLLNEQGEIMFSSEQDKIGKPLAGEDASLASLEGDSGYVDRDRAIQVYEKLELSYANWTLVKRIPYEVLYRTSTGLITINAVIAVLALLVVIIGTLFISIRITRPIKQLASYMNEIQTGKLHVAIEDGGQDEIGMLSRRFRQMMETINNLILRKYKLELANQTNQIKALQAQIDPHFLYNSLQSIGTLALQNQGPRVYSLLTSLAEIMRYKMRSNEDMVTLKEEITYLKMYLDLQKERFDEQFEVIWELDEECLNASIPKITLQPLVENYFKHGMEPQLGKGHLAVRAYRGSLSRLVIEIENDGCSIPDERLRALQHHLGTLTSEWEDAEHEQEHVPQSQEPESIGLENVLLRLKLYTDDSAALQIENVKPHGVKITLDYAWESERHESSNRG